MIDFPILAMMIIFKNNDILTHNCIMQPAIVTEMNESSHVPYCVGMPVHK